MSDEYDIEELKKLLEKASGAIKKDERGTPTDNGGILHFIKTYDIKNGTYKVNHFVIYLKYKSLIEDTFNAGSRKNYLLKPIAFFRYFNKCFEKHRTSKNTYYLLNTNFGITTASQKKYLRTIYNKRYNWKTLKNEQKKESEPNSEN